MSPREPMYFSCLMFCLSGPVGVVVDPPLLRVAVEGSDNPIS